VNYKVVQGPNQKWVECIPSGNLIASEADALDWVAVCGEYGAGALLIHAESLPDAFFDLSSGLAGAILLKFANYRLRLAAVISPEKTNRGKFREMVLETNRGNDFRVFTDGARAEAWLGE